MEPIYRGLARRTRAALPVTAWGFRPSRLPLDWHGYPNHNHTPDAFDPHREEVFVSLRTVRAGHDDDPHTSCHAGLLERFEASAEEREDGVDWPSRLFGCPRFASPDDASRPPESEFAPVLRDPAGSSSPTPAARGPVRRRPGVRRSVAGDVRCRDHTLWMEP